MWNKPLATMTGVGINIYQRPDGLTVVVLQYNTNINALSSKSAYTYDWTRLIIHVLPPGNLVIDAEIQVWVSIINSRSTRV